MYHRFTEAGTDLWSLALSFLRAGPLDQGIQDPASLEGTKQATVSLKRAGAGNKGIEWGDLIKRARDNPFSTSGRDLLSAVHSVGKTWQQCGLLCWGSKEGRKAGFL